MVVKKEEIPVADEKIEESSEPRAELSFWERYQMLGAYVREQAPKVLKFDSNVSNIDYDYVDTQQYKSFLGMCADACDMSFTWSTYRPELTLAKNDNGKQIFIIIITGCATFRDKYSEERIELDISGMGISVGNNYALSIANTNAIRNFITNNFLIPTNDRDNDDMKATIGDSNFLTDKAKAEQRKELLDSTKTVNEYATVAFGKVVYKRIEETLANDIPADFRKTLEKFKASKFENGEPKRLDGQKNVWIVKKKAANAILGDLDAHNE